MTKEELRCAEDIITNLRLIKKCDLQELKAFTKPAQDIKTVLGLLGDFMFDRKGSDLAFVKKELLSKMEVLMDWNLETMNNLSKNQIGVLKKFE